MNPRDRICRHPGPHLGGQMVACDDLRDVIVPILESYDPERVTNPNSSGNGTIDRVCDEVAAVYDRSAEAVKRRLWGIRSGETEKTSFSLADALLLALDEHFDCHDIPVYPSSMQGAREMVDVHCEDWSLPERKRMAVSLFRFTQGFWSPQALEPFEDEEAIAA